MKYMSHTIVKCTVARVLTELIHYNNGAGSHLGYSSTVAVWR